MSAFLLIFICLGVGAALRASGRFHAETHHVLNALVLNVSLPAVALTAISDLHVGWGLLFPAAMAWIVFAGGWLVIRGLAKAMRWSPDTQAALILTSGLGNTSFVGFPLLEAWLGPRSLSVALIVDQLGSFLVVSSLGLLVASSTSPLRAGQVIRRLLSFPPFVALTVAILLRLAGWQLPGIWPGILTDALKRLGSTMVPLALISVGFQLRWDFQSIRRYRSPLATGLLYKLILAPSLIFGLALLMHALPAESARVTILEAAMGPMVTGAILALDHDRDPELASLMIAWGIPLSLLTVAGWVALTARFA